MSDILSQKNKSTQDGQEKLAGALSYILFFIPILLGKKTEYTVFHMKQSFGIFCSLLVLGIFFQVPVIGWILMIIAYLGLPLMIFLGWQAYIGNMFRIPFLYDRTSMLIQKAGLEGFFSVSQ